MGDRAFLLQILLLRSYQGPIDPNLNISAPQKGIIFLKYINDSIWYQLILVIENIFTCAH